MSWLVTAHPIQPLGGGFGLGVVPSSELAPLFPFLLLWGPLCFPLTRQKRSHFLLGSDFSSLGSRFWLSVIPNSFGQLSGRLQKKGSEAVGHIAWAYLA